MIEIPGYTIKKVIGRGGMGAVYLATQEVTGRAVAIKIMAHDLAADPTFDQRFVKEARCANLTHPHIVTIFDAGRISGANYIIMEYLSGEDLVTRIRQGLTPQASVRIVTQIANALHYAWGEGYVHRDVKPANILFREDDSAVLVDFGIAKIISESSQLTLAGSMVGSPKFISPERIYGVEPDNRSDLYSLGIVFYQMLTGQAPYNGPTIMAITHKHVYDPIPVLPDKLAKYQSIINLLLAKDPRDRFEDARQLSAAFDALARPELKIVVPKQKSHINQTLPARDSPIDLQQTMVRDISTIMPPISMNANRKWGGRLVAIILSLCSLLFWREIEVHPLPPVPVPSASFVISAMLEPVAVGDNIESVFEQPLAKAKVYLQKRSYTNPEGANAFDIYQRILAIDPGNSRALAGLDSIVSGYHMLSKERLKHGKISMALLFANKGLEIDTMDSALLALRSKLEILLAQYGSNMP